MMKNFSPKLVRFFHWLDDNILLILSSFLLAFIPLYPKIPLWSPIEQYIVRVRLEDIFILLTAVIWGIQVLRGRVKWRSPMLWVVLAYAIVGALSTVSAIFITKTVPLAPLHIGKTLLHYFRYLEYFSLFFILFSSVRSRKEVLRALAIFAFTVLAVSLYGYGQKYFYWPVYSTMNREFSKGVRLYLTEFARVQSTFGGHYDMAAYLVISLPLLLAFAYRVRTKMVSTALHWIFWIGSWLLVLSASRTPFGAYLVAEALVIFLTALIQKGWVQKFRFLFTRGLVALLLIGILSYYFGNDMFERIGHIVKSVPVLDATVQAIDTQRKKVLSDEFVANSPLSAKKLQSMLPKGEPPKQATSTDDLAAIIASSDAEVVATVSDIPPQPVEPQPTATPVVAPPTRQLPAGVYEDIPDVVTVSTVSATGETVTKTVRKQRQWSKCALEKELSLCIRLEVLWPRAVDGFLTNPLLGSGYATLTKESVDQFTEADSTDNNYLRTLGETGALGFITFYGAVALILFFAVRNIASKDRLKSALSIGILCGSIGLLLNAIYIDVFAASKVALTYWGLAGIFLGYIFLEQNGSLLPAATLQR